MKIHIAPQGALGSGVRALFLAIVLVAASPLMARAEEGSSGLRVVTSVFPPYSFEMAGEVRGRAAVKVRNLLAKTGLPVDIEIYPWARAYKIAQETPNVLIFSIARTPAREELFHWIGEIMAFDVQVYRRADRDDVLPKATSDLAAFTFAGLAKDVKTGYLRGLGAEVSEVGSEEQGILMLHRGRVDLMAVDGASMRYRLTALDLPEKDFVSVMRLEELSKPLYLAASQGTHPEILARVRAAFAAHLY